MGVEDVVRHVQSADDSLRQAVMETEKNWPLSVWLPIFRRIRRELWLSLVDMGEVDLDRESGPSE
jgi:hypothetical protein